MVDTLVDTGPLFAMLCRSDDRHAPCAELFRHLDAPPCTTLPVVTEAMYLLGRWTDVGQGGLWRIILRGDLVIEGLSAADLRRMAVLMEGYSDLPMDFADASLVAVAERLGLRRIITLDRHFSVYRLKGRESFVIVGG